MMFDAPVPYTKWRLSDGVILECGMSQSPSSDAGEALFIGATYSGETHYFDPVTGDPIERTSPRPLSIEELQIEINRERTRRIELGKVIDGVYVTGRDEDARNLTNLAMGAQLRIAAGDTSLTTFRDGNNLDHSLTPVQVISIWQQSAAYVSALYAASWTLKATQPIPQDFTNNAYWPGA